MKFQREAGLPLWYGNDADFDGIGRHSYCKHAISGITVVDPWANRRARGFSNTAVPSLDSRKPQATATCNSSSFLNRQNQMTAW